MSEAHPRRRRVVVQGLGFCLGLGLLAWCVHVALRPENREHLERLQSAPAGQVVALIALSLTTLFLNATTFWTAIRPVRRVPFWDIQATNAGAALFNYAPFKLGAFLRFLVHNRRHGVPLLTIAAWLIAVSLTMTAALVPLIGAGVWRGRADWAFAAALAGGLVVTYAGALGLANVFAHEAGLGRIARVAESTRVPILGRVVRSRAFGHLHAGFAMLAHPVAFGAGVLLRVTDLLVQAARFMVAAHLAGVPMGFEGAVIVSGAYFLIGVFTPFGSLGVREFLASRLALLGYSTDALTVVALTVTASEMLVNMVCGGVGLLYLRPLRLLHRR